MNAPSLIHTRRRLVLLVGLPPHRSLTVSLASRRVGDRVEPVPTVKDALALMAAIIPDEVIAGTASIAEQLRPILERIARPGLTPVLHVDQQPANTARAS